MGLWRHGALIRGAKQRGMLLPLPDSRNSNAVQPSPLRLDAGHPIQRGRPIAEIYEVFIEKSQ
jgi:hypothetical protein